jgi:hypothetical protein
VQSQDEVFGPHLLPDVLDQPQILPVTASLIPRELSVLAARIGFLQDAPLVLYGKTTTQSTIVLRQRLPHNRQWSQLRDWRQQRKNRDLAQLIQRKVGVIVADVDSPRGGEACQLFAF